MKRIAAQRKLDTLGRIVLPEVGRLALGLEEGSLVDFYLDGNEEYLIIKKSEPACVCCGETKALKALPNGKHICEGCHGLAH